MEEYTLYFVIATAVLAVALISLELLFPARDYDHSLKKTSYLTNTLVFLSNNAITIGLQLSAVFAVVTLASPGASYFVALPVWLQVCLGILILDFSIWVWHILSHKVPVLWSFHKCHHSEEYLNATSALRFHVGEIILSALFKAVVLLLVGIPLWIFLISEFLITAFAMFHHANIEFSPKTRKYMEYIIISPYLHKVHHSDIRTEHDSNYGVIFSWWDTLFATRKKLTPRRIGLAYTEGKNFLSFVVFPFRKK